MAVSDKDPKDSGNPPTDDEKTRRDSVKAVVKEALSEFLAENAEKGRTDKGTESAPKRPSIFDIFAGS